MWTGRGKERVGSVLAWSGSRSVRMWTGSCLVRLCRWFGGGGPAVAGELVRLPDGHAEWTLVLAG